MSQYRVESPDRVSYFIEVARSMKSDGTPVMRYSVYLGGTRVMTCDQPVGRNRVEVVTVIKEHISGGGHLVDLAL